MNKRKLLSLTLCALGAVAVTASANGQTVTGGLATTYTPGKTITYSNGGLSSAKSLGESVARQQVEGKIKSLFPTFADDAPEWMKRVEFDWDYLDTSKPELSVLTVQPLYQSAQNRDTFFTQGSLYHYALYGDYRWTTNLGVGYRRLLADNTVMLGANTFFDDDFSFNHRRVSVGAEAKWGPLDLGFNNYFAITGDKPAHDSTEKALDGRDVTLSSQLPYVPWLRVGGTYFNWDKDKTSRDMSGASFNAGLALHPNFEVEYKWSSFDVNNNRADAQNTVFLRFHLARFGSPTLSTGPIYSQKIFETRDLSQETLKKVVRENRIIVERRTTAGGTITIARGD